MRRAAVFVVALTVAGVCMSAPPGAPTDANVNDPELQEALKFAVNAFNTRVNDVNMFKAGKVIRAQSQVVEGFLYSFEVEMLRTGCKKGAEMTPICYIAEPTSKPYTCSFVVWSRPWIGPPVVSKAACQQ